MPQTIKALKALYVALGGSESTVANMTLSVDILNAISALLDGATDATLIADAISNIAEVANNIDSGGSAEESDYSIANVTITMPGDKPNCRLYAPVLDRYTFTDGNEQTVEIDLASPFADETVVGTDNTIQVIMYKGCAVFRIVPQGEEEYTGTATGDITTEDYHEFLITGDGSITIAAEK